MKRAALILLVFALLAPVAHGQAPTRALSKVDFERMVRAVESRKVTVGDLERGVRDVQRQSVEPKCQDCAWPIVGGAVLVGGTKYDLHQSSAGVREMVIVEGNPIVRNVDGSVNEGLSWALTGGSLAVAGVLCWRVPKVRRVVGVALGLVGCLRVGMGVRAGRARD